MKTNLEKLTALLCEYKEVEKDIMELKFWTKILLKDYIWEKTINQLVDWFCREFYVCTIKDKFNQNDIEKIIWNQIEERHLRMYCESKWYAFAIWSNWKLIWNRNEEGSYTEIQLENSKPLSEQSEETLWQIFNFLKW